MQILIMCTSKIPGINIREEDGYGIFNNISMRGIDSARSLKITMMEDGVMSAPAPYSAPDAYYSPNVGRMSGIEVIKGSSSTKHGSPVGGVINYLSTPIPTEETFYYKQLFGNYGEARSHAYYGNPMTSEAGTCCHLSTMIVKMMVSETFSTLVAIQVSITSRSQCSKHVLSLKLLNISSSS